MTTVNPERVVLITGAGSGIGAATARRLARPGLALALHSRAAGTESRVRLDETAAEVRDQGALVRTLTGDLAEPGAAAALVEETLTQFGRLDQIVSNAGFADKRPTAELSRADLDRSFIAITAALLELVQTAREALIASPVGRVVFVSSFVAHRFVSGAVFPASAAAKSAGEALARALAIELAPHRVTVNSVVPGYTRKDHGSGVLGSAAWEAAAKLTPLGRIAEPDDVAALLAFLLSEDARHITGQAIAVDGGLSLA